MRRSWLLLPAAAAGAGTGYGLDGLAPVMAGGAAAGLAPALAAGLALEWRGRPLKTPDGLLRRYDMATLGEIGRFEQTPGSAFPTDRFPDALQAYRNLAASLRAKTSPAMRAILVTSAGPEEGKSTTAANLATVLAQTGSKVILVDADLRWSSLRSTTDGAASLGLSGLLLNYVHSPQLAVVRTHESNLFLLPAGVLPPKPAELLALPRLGDVVASLRQMADFVIFDSPPVLEAEDAALLATNVDATLIVMQAGKTRSRQVNQAMAALMKVDARPLGAVFNRSKVKTPAKVAEPTHAPAGKAVPAVEQVVRSATQGDKAPEPFTIAAFRSGVPRPKPLPRPIADVGKMDHPIHRLTASSDEGTIQEHELSTRLNASRTLRVVPPGEYPEDHAEEFRPAIATPEPVAVGTAAGHASGDVAPPEQPVSVDEVLANLESTLELIRTLRREKIDASS